MTRFIIKIVLSAIIISAVSEIGKRSSTTAAILASLPLTSILALTWLYIDTQDANKVAELSMGIFWIVIPSLVFFVSLAFLLRGGYKFALSLPISCVVTFVSYSAYIWILNKAGIKF